MRLELAQLESAKQDTSLDEYPEHVGHIAPAIDCADYIGEGLESSLIFSKGKSKPSRFVNIGFIIARKKEV